MSVGEKILKLRKVFGMSQDVFGDKIGVARQTVSKWESGQANPEIENIVKIAEVFDVTTDFLLQSDMTDDLVIKTAAIEKQNNAILGQQKSTATGSS